MAARASTSAAWMRALDRLVRLVGVRRIAVLLTWLHRGAPSFSFLGLSTSLELIAVLLNALGVLLAPCVALWLSLFAPHFLVSWSPLSVALLLGALAADLTLFRHEWWIQIVLARGIAETTIAHRVQRDFAPAQQELARRALDAFRSRRSLRDTQAMHLALLDVARGDLATLRAQVEVALLDPGEMREWRPMRRWPSYL